MGYRDLFANKIKRMEEYLKGEGIKDDLIENMVESGYICFNHIIYDTYYGLKNEYLPPITIEQIKFYQENKRHRRVFPPFDKIFTVKNFMEIDDILSDIKSKYKNVVYRGATNLYTFKRPFPSPYFSDSNGYEISLVSSYFRKFSQNYMERIEKESIISFLRPFLHNVYYEQFNDLWLQFENGEILHQDFCDRAESFRDKLWNNYISNTDASTVEQHYGIDSRMLDVTFDIKIALFFAFNNLVKIKNSYYDYVEIGKKEYTNAVVFVLKPHTDLLDILEWKYDDIEINGYKCIRPIRQQCTSLSSSIDAINEAASEVVAIIKFDKEFELPTDIPEKDYLFPSPKEDPFFEALIRLNPDAKEIMRYVFHEYENF